MSDQHVSPRSLPQRIAQTIRWLSVPIVLFWLAVAAITNVLVPQLEAVGEAHNVALSAPDAPSLQAFKRIGQVFHEFDSDSSAMIVLEGDQPLGADAHRFYDNLIQRISQDRKHVEHIQDFWGDPRRAHKAPTARPPTFKHFLQAIKAKRCPWSPSTQSATS
jgi:RND superfamily putative drug exporter